MTRILFPEIYLLRHGKTLWNSQGRLQGQLDSALLESSYDALHAIDALFEEIECTHHFCSPIGRVGSSISVMGKLRLAEWAKKDALMEISCGKYEGRLITEIPDCFIEERNRNPWETRWPEGESFSDVHNRTQSFIESLQYLKGPVCIFGHETVNRVLIGHLLGLDPKIVTGLKHPNEVVFRIHQGVLDWVSVGHSWVKSSAISKISK